MLNYYLLEMTQDIDPEKIREISRKTDFVSAILGIIVLVVFLLLVVYLVYFYKTTKRPTRSTDRFKNYKTVSGKITEVEMVSYYVKKYEEKKEDPQKDKEHGLAYDAVFRDLRYSDSYKNPSVQRDHYNDSLNKIRKSMDETKDKKNEVEKIRFRVRYEFSTDSSNLYTGECFVYEKNDDIEIGKYIEVRYNPENPLNNFTKFSNPVGVF